MRRPPSSAATALQWLGLVGAIWLQTINGPNSDFAVYSTELKALKHISQVQLNLLAFASDAGKLFGWFSGVAALYIPLWAVAFVGATFGLVGYGVQYLFVDRTAMSYAQLFILTAVAGNGICWINTACYLLCIRSFGADSRIVVGLSTSYSGLSAKVYTVAAEAFFHPAAAGTAAVAKTKAYLLLNAVSPMLISAVVAPCLRIVDPASRCEDGRGTAFVMMFLITLATGVCAVVGSFGSAKGWLSSQSHMLSLGVLLASPLLVPMAMRAMESMRQIREANSMRVHSMSIHDIETAAARALEMEAAEEKDDSHPGAGEGKDPAELPDQEFNFGGLEMVKTIEFWLYFFSYLFSGTLGLVFLNNLGQISESRGLSEASTTTLVSVSSSFGFFGRLIPSIFDYYSAKIGISVSRTRSMALLMVPMAGSFFLLLNDSASILYVGTGVVGACTGAITTIAVSATSELFGAKNFGVNHNIVVANIPVGSFCFGYLAALLYQRGAGGSGGGRGQQKMCLGSQCYGATFVLWGALCTVGALLCAILHILSHRRRRRRSTVGEARPATAAVHDVHTMAN